MSERRAAARFIFFTLFLDILGIGLIVPILPALVTDFVGGDASVGAAWYGPIQALYAAMQFIAAPVLGALSDRYGRRPVLLVALLGYGIDYIILGFAPTLAWLVIGRVLAGITGASYTTAAAYLADISTPETRAKNFGLIGAAFGLGFIAGPTLGGLLGAYWDRLPFFVAAGLVFLNLLYGLFVLPESLPADARRAFDWRDMNPFRSILRLANYTGVLGLVAIVVMSGMAQRGLENLWVLYTDYRYGWGIQESGYSLGVVGVCAVIVQGGLIRRVVPAIGEKRAVFYGFMGAALAQLAIGAAPTALWVLAAIPLASLSGFAIPTIQGIIAGRVPANEQGQVQGAVTALMAIVAIVAPLVSTGLFTRTTGDDGFMELPGAPFYLHAVFFLMSALLSVYILRNHVDGNAGNRRGATVSESA